LTARLNNDISNSEFIGAVKSTIEAEFVSEIDKHNSLERHQHKPRIPIGPLAGHIRRDIANIVEDLIRTKEAALRARIDALHLSGDARRAAVNRIVRATESRITRDLATTLNSKFSETLSKDDYWFERADG
jgi:hypothetical protein